MFYIQLLIGESCDYGQRAHVISSFLGGISSEISDQLRI